MLEDELCQKKCKPKHCRKKGPTGPTGPYGPRGC